MKKKVPFKTGDRQLTFKRKDGKKFTKTYRTPSAAAKSFKAWIRKGGSKPVSGFFDKTYSQFKVRLKGMRLSDSYQRKANAYRRKHNL